jgi:hypothetical protein
MLKRTPMMNKGQVLKSIDVGLFGGKDILLPVVVVLVSGKGGLKGFFGGVGFINLEPTTPIHRAPGVFRHNKLLCFFQSSASCLSIIMESKGIQK